MNDYAAFPCPSGGNCHLCGGSGCAQCQWSGDCKNPDHK